MPSRIASAWKIRTRRCVQIKKKREIKEKAYPSHLQVRKKIFIIDKTAGVFYLQEDLWLWNRRNIVMGHTYVMSDIHGMSHLLEEMLGRIGFSPEDRLYILGDLIDRGTDPAGVLDLVMGKENITVLTGNHEDAFASWYESEADKVGNPYDYNTYEILMDSRKTGEKLPEYVRFMKGLPLYKKVKLDGICYLLAHASTEEALRVWKRRDPFIWDSSMVDRQRGIPGYVSIVGHVPTFIIRGYPHEPATIWRSPDGRLIDVDCGAVFPVMGGRLGCLCLETGEEFYVQDKRL